MFQDLPRITTSFFVVKEGRGQDNKGPELTTSKGVFVYMLLYSNYLAYKLPAIPYMLGHLP